MLFTLNKNIDEILFMHLITFPYVRRTKIKIAKDDPILYYIRILDEEKVDSKFEDLIKFEK